MKIAIGSDHGGFLLKQSIVNALVSDNIDITDIGTHDAEPKDYPLYAEKVGLLVAQGKADFGILICKTGIGMSIAANKISGVRAALPCDKDLAVMSRKHNNANIVCLGGGMDINKALDIVRVFINTHFEGEKSGGERHARRVSQIARIERTHIRNKEE